MREAHRNARKRTLLEQVGSLPVILVGFSAQAERWVASLLMVSLLVLVSSCGGGASDSTQPGTVTCTNTGTNNLPCEPIIPIGPVGKPNIVLILTDDQNLGFERYMVNLQQKLIDKGVWFENAYVTTSLCCPSRVSILTGQYTHNHQVLSNAGRGGYSVYEKSGGYSNHLGVWMQDAGYRTALIGKFLNNYPAENLPLTPIVPPGWDDWFAAVDTSSAPSPYLQFNYRMVDNGIFRDYGSAETDYFGDVVTDRALKFMNTALADKTPFFLFLNYISPHAPEIAAPRHRVPRTDQVPRTPSFNEVDVSDKPAWVRLNSLLIDSQIADVDRVFGGRINSLQSVDEGIDQIVALLTSKGALENTYIIFTSDNGFHLGQHRVMWNKNTPYEESIRVPMAIRGPAIPYGLIAKGFALNIDLAPTILELAGADIPATVDGRSLSPLWKAPKFETPSNWRHRFLVEHFSPTASGVNQINKDPYFLEYASIRDEKSMFTIYDYGDWESYSMDTDPYQLNNTVADWSADQAITAAALLNEMRQCAGSICRSVENR